MNRERFMKELDYLLQDIPEEEKADALAYYADYLDEAGEENEEQVLREFGSPERIAAIIRADLSGNLEDGGGFTDRGYEDERFRDPNYSVAPRMDLPEQRERPKEESREADSKAAGYQSGEREQPVEQKQKKKTNGWKIACLVLLILITCPLWITLMGVALGVIGGGAGLLLGLLAVLAVFLLCLAVWTGAWLIGGLLAVIVGFVVIFAPGDLANGIWCVGTGVACIGVGILSLAVCILFYGKFLPWLIRLLVNAVSRLVHRKKRREERA